MILSLICATTMTGLPATTSFKGQDVPKAKGVVTFDAKEFAPGSIIKGKITITIPEGFHGYQNPPAKDYQIPFALESATPKLKMQFAYPLGVTKTSMGEESALYEGKIVVPFHFTGASKVAAYNVAIKFSYQLCDDSSCFPPVSEVLKATYKVTKKGVKLTAKPVAKP